MVRVKRMWSQCRISTVPPWRAVEVFTVTGASTQSQALTATDGDVTVYQRGDGHPYNRTRLQCEGPEIVGPFGVDGYIVSCSFSIDYCSPLDQADDPLDLPPRITWSTIEELRQSDHDLDSRPLLNAAADFFPAVGQTITYKQLTIVKNFPYYDILLSRDYENAVNRDPVYLAESISCAAQHMRCRIIEPAVQGYEPGVPYLPIRFVWDVMAEGVLGAYPFQHKFLNAGSNGWYLDSGSKKQCGSFVNLNGDPILRDVRLNETGTPLAKPNGVGNVKVASLTSGVQAPTTPQDPVTPYITEFYKNDGSKQGITVANGETSAIFYYYKGARVVDYAPLTSLF